MTIPSPPPPYNFTELPQVVSRLPRWSVMKMKAIPEVPAEPIHVPGGSYWPLVTAVGIVVIATGAIMHSLWVVLAAVAAVVISIYSWAFEPFEA